MKERRAEELEVGDAGVARRQGSVEYIQTTPKQFPVEHSSYPAFHRRLLVAGWLSGCCVCRRRRRRRCPLS